MLDVLTTIISLGAAARLTRLATADTITERPRNALLARVAQPRRVRAAAAQGHDAPPPTPVRAWFLDLLTCHWCLGLWITAGVFALALAAGHTLPYQVAATVLAAAYAVGWLADNERD